MLYGIICVIVFCIGLFIGLSLEYKNKSTMVKTNSIEKKNIESNTNNVYPNELTSEIIDEWINGSDEQ